MIELNYYYGAVFNGLGIVFMSSQNQYFWMGAILAIVGFGMCAYSYKKMEKRAELTGSAGGRK